VSKTLEEIQKELDAPIPRDCVSEREGGGGKKLSYLTGHYVIDRLNQVFGPFGWATNTVELRLVSAGEIEGKYGKKHSAHYLAKVRLVVEAGGKTTEHNCHGYGNGFDAKDPGLAHELAAKEAETDALKRCAKNLGMSMGLALYSKDQENVADAPEPAKPVKQVAKAAPSAKNVLEAISANSLVLIKKGTWTKDAILAVLDSKYKVSTKEELKPEQAAEFLEFLKTEVKK